MNPIRREVPNGLFVIVLSTLLSAAIAAFQVKFNVQLWVLIVMGVAIAVSGYVVFEVALRFMASSEESTRHREEEWLKRVGTPARLEYREDEPSSVGRRWRGRKGHEARQRLHDHILSAQTTTCPDLLGTFKNPNRTRGSQ